MKNRDSGFGVRDSGLAISLSLGLIVALSLPGFAAKSSVGAAESGLKITVLVFDYAQVPRGILAGGIKQATKIFREVGIETAWVNCTAHSPEAERDTACYQSLRPTYLLLRIHPHFQDADGIFLDTTLGFSLLAAERGRSAYASVFYDHVEDLAETSGVWRDQILGHAIAHELGHLLLGTMGHSSTGLMRAKWNRQDLQRATLERLIFTPQQAELLRADVQARMELQEVILAPSVASQK